MIAASRKINTTVIRIIIVVIAATELPSYLSLIAFLILYAGRVKNGEYHFLTRPAYSITRVPRNG